MICWPEPAPVLVTLTVWDAGAGAFGNCENVRDAGATLSVFDDVTFNVTGTVCGLLVTVADAAVIVTVPV